MALQSYEIALIVLAIIILFGGAAIPKLARSIGRAKGEFQAARSEFDREASKSEEAARARSAAQRASETTGSAAPAAPAVPATPSAPPASEEDVRKAARDLGIDEGSMTLEQVKKALNELLG